ncbi:MAG: hypothetical protein WBN66_03600 [Smithella sp.]
MADTQTYNWDDVNVNESITAEEQKASENISNSTPVGTFLCTIAESVAKENAMSAYTCIAAGWKMRIDSVIEIEQPVFDDKGQAVKRDGQQLMKVLPVKDAAKKNADALNVGRFIFDDINLFHVKEKEAMKKRRIFIAKKAGLITSESAQMTGKMWGPGAVGRQVVVKTEWNSWKDKTTGELKKNVKVAWDGYDYAEVAGAPADDDFSGI